MKVEYLNPIINATVSVFQNMFNIELERGTMQVTTESISGKKANVSIGVTGQLKGSIVFSFTETLALGIVEEMAGMKMNQLDKFVTSAIGELANIISGHAMTNLAGVGYQCDIVPPQINVGDEQRIYMATEKILVMPFTSRFGVFDLSISLQEVK